MMIGADQIRRGLFLLARVELCVDLHMKVVLRLASYTLVPLDAAGDDDGIMS